MKRKSSLEDPANTIQAYLLTMTRLVLTFVRHGETLENRNKIIQGQLNTHLNELGRRQSEAVAIALKDVPFQRAFSSDLNRAKEVGYR